MNWDQITVLLPSICGLVTAIGSVIVAICTVRFQGAQELKRTELAHKWQEKEREQERAAAVEDRNISRKWLLTDKQIEERKNYLLAHKRFVDDYIANLLALTSRVYMRSIGLEQYISDGMKPPYIQSLEQSAKVYHHVEAFGSAELRQQFQYLMETVDEYLVPVLREPEKNQDKAANLCATIADVTAPVSKAMETILVGEL